MTPPPLAESSLSAETAADARPRFASVLVARSNQERPTELEVHLRPHCEKMRVHAKLSGAHMIFPLDHGSSLALRIYYCNDENDVPSKNDSDWDGMTSFLRHFQFTLVLFVMPHYPLKQTSSWSKFVSWVQEEQYQKDEDHSSGLEDSAGPPPSRACCCPPRLVVVSNAQQALDAIWTVTEALGPIKRQLRTAFWERQQQCDQESLVVVATAVRAWAARLGLLHGEADLLLACCHSSATGTNSRPASTLATLARLASQGLPGIPVDPQSRDTLQVLFGKDSDDHNTQLQQFGGNRGDFAVVDEDGASMMWEQTMDSSSPYWDNHSQQQQPHQHQQWPLYEDQADYHAAAAASDAFAGTLSPWIPPTHYPPHHHSQQQRQQVGPPPPSAWHAAPSWMQQPQQQQMLPVQPPTGMQQQSQPYLHASRTFGSPPSAAAGGYPAYR